MQIRGFLWLIFGIIGVNSFAQTNNLPKLQQEIKQQQNKIAEQKKKRDDLQATLKSQEKEMNRVSENLKKTESTLGDLKKEIQRTEKDIARLEKQEKEQKEKLKIQLDSAYRSGINPSLLERLLSESAKDAGRMEVYYEHINQVRIDAINELRQTQAHLKQRRDDLKAQQQGQQSQLNEQKHLERELTKVKNERAKTIQALDKTLDREQAKLARLKENEVALRNQIAAAEQASKQRAKEREQQALAKLEKDQKRNATEKEKAAVREQVRKEVSGGNGLGNGKFAMPVAGKVIHSFNSINMGEIKWDGIVIQASAGTPVKAIAGGKVLIASWTRGYGNLVVIDHGNNDMSFYGYNQSLAVRVGAKVSAGQTIANVGNTGDLSSAALYFAIRRKGVAQNPRRWLK